MPGDTSRQNGKKGGRPLGSKNAETLERERVLAAMKQRIMKSADALFNAAKSNAIGNQYLYKIETEVDKNGKEKRGKPELVTSSVEIAKVLDEMEDMGAWRDDDNNLYYYISTKEPNIKAFEALVDRAFGKVPQSLDVNETKRILILEENEEEDGED